MMKVTLPEKSKIRKRDLIIYVSIMIVCIISIIIAFYVQFYARIDIINLFGVNTNQEFGSKTDEQKEILKSEFDDIFTNSVQNDESRNSDKKANKDKELVYVGYEKKENKTNSYDIEVNIPHINIESDVINKYNEEIEKLFITKAEDVLKSENKNTIYTVEFVANVQEDILSLMIRSNLKEGLSAQRVIIQTYNYDLRNNKEITLEEILRIKQLDKQAVQSQIRKEIEVEQKKVEDLKKLGYNIYNRDISSDIYEVDKTTEFYLTENTLYILYAYGNESFTSEIDLVIL
ncbi:MAG: hypothetical protein HFJ40_07960 [Clostridia bacterium]|nr:hypothetical protein [Clostridia bacterium]